MALCYQKHPFGIESEDRLTTINTKIFEIKKKIQLSEGQRKSNYEENEAEKQQNSNLIETLKKEIKESIKELAVARAIIGEEEFRIKKYLNDICPVANKTPDQIIHNLDLKVIELRKSLDLLKYDRKKKKTRLKNLEKEYEHLLLENTKIGIERLKSSNPVKKHASHLENEIHKVTVQWNEAELVKKKYGTIRQALLDDSVKFESSLAQLEAILKAQNEEILKLEVIKAEALDMRAKATAALNTESSRAADADRIRQQERAYFAHCFDEREKELEMLQKRIFPPAPRQVVRQDSAGSGELTAVLEESSSTNTANVVEDMFQRLMKLTGSTEPDQVLERWNAQRETGSRLQQLQLSTEQEKLALEGKQATLLNQLDHYKLLQLSDKDEATEKINELKFKIGEENVKFETLTKKLNDTNYLLVEVKTLFYDLCRMLDVVQKPDIPEWTFEPRDVFDILNVLKTRFSIAAERYQDIRLKNEDLGLPVSLTVALESAKASLTAASTPRTKDTKEQDLPPTMTYKELVKTEPVKTMASDEDDDIPSRSYLKRQAQIIVDTKSRRKGYRIPYPRK